MYAELAFLFLLLLLGHLPLPICIVKVDIINYTPTPTHNTNIYIYMYIYECVYAIYIHKYMDALRAVCILYASSGALAFLILLLLLGHFPLPT